MFVKIDQKLSKGFNSWKERMLTNGEKLKKYGIGWCGDTVGFFGHWDKNGIIKTETELFPFLKELESNWPMIFGNLTILDDSQNKIIDGWK